MKAQGAANGYLMSKGYSFYIFGLLFLLYFFDYVDRQVVVALFPYLRDPVDGWGLTNAQCGMLVTAVYWSILICTFPISIIVDRWSRKKSIGIMATLWGFATLACAFTTNFTQLFAARTVIGVGEAGYAPGGTAMISAVFPERMRSIMVGIWNASIPLGMAGGLVIGGIVAQHLGWRHAFGIVAVPGLLVALAFFFIKDYKTVSLDEQELAPEAALGAQTKAVAKKMSKMALVREFTRTPSVLLNYFGFAGMMFLSTSYVSFLPTYFAQAKGVAETQANMMTSGILITALIGAPLGGYIADKWMNRDLRGRMLTSSLAAFATSGLFFLGFTALEGSGAQYPVLVVAGLCSSMYASSAIAVTQDVIHPGLRAISYALCVIIQHMFGSAIGSFIVGHWIDTSGIVSAMATVPVVSVTSGVLFMIGAKFYPRDLAKVAKVNLVLED